MDSPGPAITEPDQRRFIRRVLLVVGLVGVVALTLVIFGLAWTAMLTLFGGALIGVILDGVATRVHGWTRVPRKLVLALVLLGLAGLSVGAGLWLGPALVEQLEGLREQVMIAVERLREWVAARHAGPRLLEDIDELRLSSLMTPGFGGLLSTTAGVLTSLILVAVFGVYFAIDPAVYTGGFVRLVPPAHRGRAWELLGAIARGLRSWFLGRLLSMIVVGIGTTLGLWIAKVPLALPLGIFAGLLSFVPNLGPIMAALPGILVGFSVSPQIALWATLVYVIVQIIENYAITPFIDQRAVSMPPVLLLAFQMLMGLSGGVIGLFMATPLLVTIVLMVQVLYVRDTLGDEVELIGE
jgi:predicted PurR-regulated permease PerM